jgi:hypothetical protein
MPGADTKTSLKQVDRNNCVGNEGPSRGGHESSEEQLRELSYQE